MTHPLTTRSEGVPVYLPENNPYHTILIDVTHRCNMNCHNCYIPNRTIPDMDIDWLAAVLKRLPNRTRIRIVGAEPTLRKDLPEIIEWVRRTGHLPILMTNGLKLANRDYLKRLKASGLRSVYLSFNGGLDDNLYETIDGLRCAKRKLRALENACAENMYLSLGMILVRGVNESQFGEFYRRIAQHRQVYELHVRSIGAFGRYMKSVPFTMNEMIELCCNQLGILNRHHIEETSYEIKLGRLKLQFTEWPDLGSQTRGRLAPEGTIQPFFEHMAANEGGY